MRTDLVIDALTAAQRTRGSLDGAIMHTDHGAQYTSSLRCCLHHGGVRQSMSKVGSSADNALAESFNATFKRETLQGRRAFTDERDARLRLTVPLAAPLQHRPPPLPARTAVPDHLRTNPRNTSYAGHSRINPVSKIRGQAPAFTGVISSPGRSLASILGPPHGGAMHFG